MKDVRIDQIRTRVLPDGRVSRSDAAAFLGLSSKTLAMWWSEKKGPASVLVGGRRFYWIDDLRRFSSGEG